MCRRVGSKGEIICGHICSIYENNGCGQNVGYLSTIKPPRGPIKECQPIIFFPSPIEATIMWTVYFALDGKAYFLITVTLDFILQIERN